MKRIQSLATFYLGLFAFTIIVQSCCSDPNMVSIIGGEDIFFLEQQDLPFSGAESATTLTGLPFSMRVNMELEFVSTYTAQGFMSSAYAFSCEEEYQNSLDGESFSLTCDTNFIFDGEIITAGTPFSELNGLIVSVGFEEVSVFVGQEFLDLAEFTNGAHNFTMFIRTTDNLDIESKGSVEIDF